MTREQLVQLLKDYRCCRTVTDRVLRLNPNGTKEGTIPRGWNRKRGRGWRIIMNWPSRNDVVSKFGLDAWEDMPACGFMRDGKRKYISPFALHDHLWLVPDGHPTRQRPSSRFGIRGLRQVVH